MKKPPHDAFGRYDGLGFFGDSRYEQIFLKSLQEMNV